MCSPKHASLVDEPANEILNISKVDRLNTRFVFDDVQCYCHKVLAIRFVPRSIQPLHHSSSPLCPLNIRTSLQVMARRLHAFS